MSKIFRLNARLILLSGAIALFSSSCLSDRTPTSVSSPTSLSPASPAPSVTAPQVSPALGSPPVPLPPTPATLAVPSSPVVNPYELAMDKAISATSIGSSAQSEEDWNLVIHQWEQAIALMKTVPKSSPYQVLAKSKIIDFEKKLSAAREQVKRLRASPQPNGEELASSQGRNLIQPNADRIRSTSSPSRTAKPVPTQKQSFQTRIKRRIGATPVIEATFNGKYKFDMVLDTGASGTVITQAMAAQLGVVPMDTVIVDTASAKGLEIPLGFVDAIDVGGLTLRTVPVVIAGPELEIGLLGQNFFGEYDVIIRQNLIEFHTR